MKSFKSCSLRCRLSLFNVLLIFITAVSIGMILTYTFITREFEARYDYNIELARLLAKNSELAVYTEQQQALQKLLSPVRHLTGIKSITIIDRQGRPLASFQNSNHPPDTVASLLWQSWVKTSGQDFTLIIQDIVSDDQQDEASLFSTNHSLKDQQKTIGQLVLETDLIYFQDLLYQAFIRGLLITSLILLISLFCATFFSIRVTRPLNELVQAAHSIISGKATKITRQPHSKELWELVNAFNKMSEWLENYHVEIKEYQRQLERQAFYDELTGLGNRNMLKEHLKSAISYAKRHQKIAAIMFLDLDRFKYINDTLGHSIGDALLQEVAQRLRALLRDCDNIARMGGDEFIIIINDLNSYHLQAKQDVSRIAKDIGKKLNRPFSIAGHELSCSFSIGIAFYPHDGDDTEILTRNADTAMYQAKSKGRNTYSFYDPALQQHDKRRLSLEHGLKQAIALNELFLCYQPKVDLKTGKLVGAEALLRWKHRDKIISPIEFIPLAEETGQMIPIGDWVLSTVLTTLREWRNSAIVADDFYLSVNISSQQIFQQNFADQTLAIVNDILPNQPGLLELELTESCLLKPTEHSLLAFNQLHDGGLRLAIDDFGTGYSSLSYLKQFPLDMLKIDQSFVRDCLTDPSDATIIRATIAMARGLGLEVIAEGVETAHHIDFLLQEGCYLIQGYYLSKPLPAEAFVQFVRHYSQHPVHAVVKRQ